jgi:hypothetical protein
MEPLKDWEETLYNRDGNMNTHGTFTFGASSEVERLRAEAATMRGLLEAITKDDLKGYSGDAGDMHHCAWCQLDRLTFQPLEHYPECPLVKARAFLADHPT